MAAVTNLSSHIADAVRTRIAFGVVVFHLSCPAAWPQAPVSSGPSLNQRVLVVYNAKVSESRAVAKYYMAQRKIPEGNGCKISVDSEEAINLAEFESRVKKPIRTCLEAAGKQKILYIVFSYGSPFLLTILDKNYSLDQFVADIWDEYSPDVNKAGPQPYFGVAQSQGNAYARFVPLSSYRNQTNALKIYSVWRLDAADARLAKGLVDKAIFAEQHGLSGNGCFDLQFGGVEALADYGGASGDWDVHQAAWFATRAGFRVIEDQHPVEFGTAPAPLRCETAALYAGWYSLNHYNDAFTWNPGAIGIHLDSASAASPRGGTNWAANAVNRGITITSGAVAEPFLAGLPHPDQVFLYLFQGANAGDALLRSTQWLKWMILNIGDPLYRPFPDGVSPFNSSANHEAFLALAQQGTTGGSRFSGIVGLPNAAPAAGTPVSLKSDRPEVVNLPQEITIAQNEYTAQFSVVTKAVTSETVVRVSMIAGDAKRSNTLVLYPSQSR